MDGATGVLFVPGFGHAERGWDLLRRHLERAGISDVAGSGRALDRGDIPHRAERLARHVQTLRAVTGAVHVHLVGHNVGGVVARYFVQLLGGDEVVETVVTVGTPHGGSHVSPVGLGPAAAQLRPGSAVLRHLEESTRPLHTRFVSYFSHDDLFVQPATSALLKDARMRAVNLLVREHDNVSLMLPAPVCRSIAARLAVSPMRTQARAGARAGV